MKRVTLVGKVGTLAILLVVVSAGLIQGDVRTVARAAPQDTLINLSGARIRKSSLATADFNGDGYKEIVAGGEDGMLYVVSTANGVNWSTVWSRQCNDDILAANPPTPRTTNEIHSTPAIADLDGNGRLDIVIAMGGDIHVPKADRENGGVLVYQYDSAWSFSLIKLLSEDGTQGWPQPRIDRVGDDAGYGSPDGLWDGIVTTPALGDLDGDGDLEIVVAGIDRRIHAFHHTGEVVAGWPIYRYNGDNLLRGSYFSSPALGDIDGDDLPEVIVGTMSPPWDGVTDPDYNLGTVWAINGDSTNVPGFPLTTEQYIYSSPALGDIDNDGELEIVVGVGWGTSGRQNIVYAWNHDGTPLSNWPRETAGVTMAPPALGDIDNDGTPEVVIGCGNHYDSGSCNKLYAWNADGSAVSGFPMGPETPNTWMSGAYAMPYSPILADFDGDSDIEIISIHQGSHGISIVDPDGTNSEQRFEASLGGLEASPMVDDVDNDGQLEILAGGGSSNGVIKIWDESGSTSSELPWPMFRYNMQRIGLYPLDSVPPTNPTSLTSSSHTVSTWSTDNTVDITWSGADDEGTGVGRYYYIWDTTPDTVVDTGSNYVEHPTQNLTSSALADGQSHYFHLRTADKSGNLAADTLHLGPYWIDATLPVVSLTTPQCRASAFVVSWSGRDDVSGIANYDVQYRQGTGGTWTDWRMATTALAYPFTLGSAGQTYYFRVRARDVAGNVSAYTADDDHSTYVGAYAITGHVYNNSDETLFNAQIVSTPTVEFTQASDSHGEYWLCFLTQEAHEIEAMHPMMGDLVGTMFVGAPVATGAVSGVDLYLPPAENWLTNGEFETGSQGWTIIGNVLVGTGRTGIGAAALQCAGTCSISQTVSIPASARSPVLSWMWKAEELSPATHIATVTLTSDTDVYSIPFDLGQLGWQHSWVSAEQYIGQQVSVLFECQSLAGLQSLGALASALTLDEISFGEYVSPGRLYLPMILRS
jgi:hypothetical protein